MTCATLSHEMTCTLYLGSGALVVVVPSEAGTSVWTRKYAMEVAVWLITGGIGVPVPTSMLAVSTDAWLSELLILDIARRASCSLVMFSVVSVMCVNACLKNKVT